VEHTAPGASQLLFNADAFLLTTSCIVIAVCRLSVPGDLMSFAAQLLWTPSSVTESFINHEGYVKLIF
jgi:hypothetical protein